MTEEYQPLPAPEEDPSARRRQWLVVGLFLLAGLVLGAGYDLVRGNAVKVLIILCFTVFALAVFLYNGQVRWDVGLILAVGNMAGAWVAAKVAARKGAARFVRWLLIVVVIAAAAKLLLQ